MVGVLSKKFFLRGIMGDYVLGKRAVMAELSPENAILAHMFYLYKGRFFGGYEVEGRCKSQEVVRRDKLSYLLI